jgi:hypothetical protein
MFLRRINVAAWPTLASGSMKIAGRLMKSLTVDAMGCLHWAVSKMMAGKTPLRLESLSPGA